MLLVSARSFVRSFVRSIDSFEEDYRMALKFEPKNQDCLMEMENCLQSILKVCQRKLVEDPTNQSVKDALTFTTDDLRRLQIIRSADSKTPKL